MLSDPTVSREVAFRSRSFVSQLVGIIKHVHEFLAAPDDARMFFFGCELSEATGILGHQVPPRTGGAHYLRDRALAAALGEALERYCGTQAPASHQVFASAAELGPQAVSPSDFALFHPRQYSQAGFPYRPFTPETRVQWVRGISLTDGAPVFLPAQLIFLAPGRRQGEPAIGYATSSGMACGPTRDEAVLRALLEVVERDAFMLTWYGRLTLPLLDLESDPLLCAEVRRHFAPARLHYQVVDLSVFLRVPTALAVIRGRPPDAIGLTVGAASAPTMREACGKALREAFQTRHWIRQMRQLHRRAFAPDFSDILRFEDHVLLYSYEENARRADFLIASAQLRPLQQIPPLEGATASERISAVVARLAQHGVRAYATDLTSPEVRQAGLHVVRVLCPQLCPLDVGYQRRFLGGPRLYEAAWRLGLRERPLGFEELNPYPHPFP